MAGTFFDYAPGRLEAQFSHDTEFDYINLDLKMSGETTTTTACDDRWQLARPVDHAAPAVEFQVYMSSVFCPFRDFIRFLEAITIEVQDCGFEWDPEGPSAKMHWTRRHINDTGFLTVEWHSSEKQLSHRMMLNTRQTVRSLYDAFRSFVESPDYDPLRYEGVTNGESFSMIMSNANLDDLAIRLARLDSNQADAVIVRLREIIGDRSLKGPKARHPIELFFESTETRVPLNEYDSWISAEWNLLDKDERISDLREMFGWGSMGWTGANLREIRSSLIESWLALPEPPPRRNYRIPRSIDDNPRQH